MQSYHIAIGTVGSGSSSLLSNKDDNDERESVTYKRKRSISEFSEVDEDFVVTPKRQNSNTNSRSNKSKKKSVCLKRSTKSILSFSSSGQKLAMSSKTLTQPTRLQQQCHEKEHDNVVIEIESDDSD